MNPWAYLKDVLEKIADGWPQNRIEELLPHRWAQDHPEHCHPDPTSAHFAVGLLSWFYTYDRLTDRIRMAYVYNTLHISWTIIANCLDN